LLLDLDIGGEQGSELVEELARSGEDRPAILLVTGAGEGERESDERSSQLVVHQPAGLRPQEVIHCLAALAGVLRPHEGEA
jgi:hypothetical protein